jgi:hypothetical protein
MAFRPMQYELLTHRFEREMKGFDVLQEFRRADTGRIPDLTLIRHDSAEI